MIKTKHLFSAGKSGMLKVLRKFTVVFQQTHKNSIKKTE